MGFHTFLFILFHARNELNKIVTNFEHFIIIGLPKNLLILLIFDMVGIECEIDCYYSDTLFYVFNDVRAVVPHNFSLNGLLSQSV